MKSLKLTGALAALGLIATPIAANANLSRSDAPIVGESEMGGDATTVGVIFGLLAIGAFIFISGDDNDEPVSA